MVIPNSLSVMGTPIDLKKIETPAYIQAGREDHIAPLASVWRLMDHLSGPKTFLLAGSGHIAGVVNRSEEHTSELQSLMRISYAVFCLKKKKRKRQKTQN